MAETYIARSTAIAARILGGEMMIMSALDSTFFTLNEVATVIWQAADGHDSACAKSWSGACVTNSRSNPRSPAEMPKSL